MQTARGLLVSVHSIFVAVSVCPNIFVFFFSTLAAQAVDVVSVRIFCCAILRYVLDVKHFLIF